MYLRKWENRINSFKNKMRTWGNKIQSQNESLTIWSPRALVSGKRMDPSTLTEVKTRSQRASTSRKTIEINSGSEPQTEAPAKFRVFKKTKLWRLIKYLEEEQKCSNNYLLVTTKTKKLEGHLKSQRKSKLKQPTHQLRHHPSHILVLTWFLRSRILMKSPRSKLGKLSWRTHFDPSYRQRLV